MALEVQKKENENPQNLIRRFIYKIHKSGILVEARKRAFYRKSKNKREKKLSALRKIEKRKEAEKSKMLGQS